MPKSCTASDRGFKPPGSLAALGVQSPRPSRSLLRAPNQPSSSTIISTPSAAACFAKRMSLSESKSNSIASQLLISTGRRRSFQGLLMMWRRMKRCRRMDRSPSPPSVKQRAASGAVKLSPGFRYHENASGLMPLTTRTDSVWSTSMSVRWLPLYSGSMPTHSPRVSVAEGSTSATKGLW